MLSKKKYQVLTWKDFDECVYFMTEFLQQQNIPKDVPLMPIPRGGLALALALSHTTGREMHRLPVPALVPHSIVVDDIRDQGTTLRNLCTHGQPRALLLWLARPALTMHKTPIYAHILKEDQRWVKFPWETTAGLLADEAQHRARTKG